MRRQNFFCIKQDNRVCLTTSNALEIVDVELSLEGRELKVKLIVSDPYLQTIPNSHQD